jgi:hypothetical protein
MYIVFKESEKQDGYVIRAMNKSSFNNAMKMKTLGSYQFNPGCL